MLNRLSHPQQNCRKINFGSSSLSEHPQLFTFRFLSGGDHGLCANPDQCDNFVKEHVTSLANEINAPVNGQRAASMEEKLRGITTLGDFLEATAPDPTKPSVETIHTVVAKFLVEQHLKARGTGFLTKGQQECDQACDFAITDVLNLSTTAETNGLSYGDYPSQVLGRMVTGLGDLSGHLLTTLTNHLNPSSKLNISQSSFPTVSPSNHSQFFSFKLLSGDVGLCTDPKGCDEFVNTYTAKLVNDNTTDSTRHHVHEVVAQCLVDQHFNAKVRKYLPSGEPECIYARRQSQKTIYELSDNAKIMGGLFGDDSSQVLGRMLTGLGDVSEHLLTTLVGHLRK